MTTQGAERIAASLQRNTNLRTLSLGGLEDSHFTVILQGLETNSSLLSLSLDTRSSSLPVFSCDRATFGPHNIHPGYKV